MRAALTALLLASSIQETAAEAWGPAPTPLPELGLKGTALLGGTVVHTRRNRVPAHIRVGDAAVQHLSRECVAQVRGRVTSAMRPCSTGVAAVSASMIGESTAR